MGTPTFNNLPQRGPNYLAWLKTVLSIAVGGAAGAVVNFFTNSNNTWTRIDWHQMGLSAGVGAIVAVAHYLMPSPMGKA